MAGAVGRQRCATTAAATHFHDLPEPLLHQIFSLLSDVRSRNAASLVCLRWRALERSTRSVLALRGHLRPPFRLPPTCFPFVSHLDLSLLSPWGGGYPFSVDGALAAEDDQHLLVAARLAQAFPSVSSLVVYSRDPTVLAALAPHWPGLRHAKLVRWHQRPHYLPLGADLAPLLSATASRLCSLDLSEFYCWTEDVPQALRDHPGAAAALTRLDLLCAASSDGFRASDLATIASACPNLAHLRAPCVFDPRCFEFVSDEAILGLAAACPRLSLLYLVDPATLSPARGDHDASKEDAGITGSGLEELFLRLPGLESLALDLRQHVRDAAPALETLGHKCPKLRSLKLGQFHSVCRGAWEHLDGVSVCGALVSLCIKNSLDLTDAGLSTIARGCQRLSKLEIHGCRSVTELGIKKLAGALRSTLSDVSISACELLDASQSLRALEPVRDRLERLHIDGVWARPELNSSAESGSHGYLHHDDSNGKAVDKEKEDEDSAYESKTKKCRYSQSLDTTFESNGAGYIFRTWKQLRFLSLWLPAGEILTRLTEVGLDNCPNLEDVCIKVEGDCRTCPKPRQLEFGLRILSRYPNLKRMKLDCGEAVGYVLTAPAGQMDLSLWERFYLYGIETLRLYELDYWPPQDKEVNQRSLSLPASGLIRGCITLRKLFIHGTAHEHFMRFFLEMPNLRDVQLRADYYPAPENDMSTEMRVDSCSRFEDVLNSRTIPD